MTTCGRILARLNSIERKYGDVALAAAMFCLAIAIHGAFAVASLHRQAGLSDASDNSRIVAQLEQYSNRAFLANFDRPIRATTEQHEKTFGQISEQSTISTANSTVETAPAKPADMPRDTASAQEQSVPAASVRSIVANAATADQVDDTVDKPAISALAANDDGGSAPLAVSALLGDDTNVLSESAPLSQPAISAVTP